MFLNLPGAHEHHILAELEALALRFVHGVVKSWASWRRGGNAVGGSSSFAATLGLLKMQ